MLLEAEQSLPVVPLSSLPIGSAFRHGEVFWIKGNQVVGGYITCINIGNGVVDGFRPAAEVTPQADAKVVGLVY
nr:MAG TPA: hypothetical protein [Caudoviricetes sp.]